MSDFETTLKSLEALVFKEKNMAAASELAESIIDGARDGFEYEDFAEFLGMFAHSNKGFDENPVNEVTFSWIRAIYENKKRAGGEEFDLFAFALFQWYWKKMERLKDFENPDYNQIMAELFVDVINWLPSDDFEELAHAVDGYAKHILIAGIQTKNFEFIDEAIKYRRRSVEINKEEDYPHEYCDPEIAVARASCYLAEALLRAYELDKAKYVGHPEEIKGILQHATELFKGTSYDGSDGKRARKLMREYKRSLK